MDARESLQRIFGFDGFRPGQEEAVAAALADRDALVVMPTGSGKSLCYQLPALMRDDLTLVVSPLVSLMQDQVAALADVAPGRVELVNAQRGRRANAERCRRAVTGEVRLLYVAPERFASARFAARDRRRPRRPVRRRRGALRLAVGPRLPARLLRARRAARPLGARATIALTATATPAVADDIVAPAGAARPASGSRPASTAPTSASPWFRAATPGRQAAPPRRGALGAPTRCRRSSTRARARPVRDGSPGCLARALGEEVGRLPRRSRSASARGAQERFMTGEVRVIVATNAFGMGIDKADVRTVCHASVPGSLEAYYQEAGRAGRDGARRAACCSPSSATRACTCSSSSARGSRTARSRASPSGCAGPGSTAATTCVLSELAGRARTGDRERRSGRSSATSRAPADRARALAARPGRGRIAVAGTPASGDRVARRRAMPSGSAGRSTARSGSTSSARSAGARRCSRTSAIVPSAAAACCDVCDAVAGLLSGTARARPRRRPAISTARSSRCVAVARAAGRSHARGRDPARRRSKVIAEYAYDSCRTTGVRAPALRDVLGRVDELLQPAAALDRGRFRSSRGMNVASSRRARARTSRRCSTTCTAGDARSSRSPRTSRRAGARAGPSAGDADRSRRAYADRAARDARSPTGWRARGRARRARRLHAAAQPVVPGRFPGA